MFIHIPKTAGKSIKSWLLTNASGAVSCEGHITYHEYIKNNNPEWSFCVVRNSYDRLISLYTFIRAKSGKKALKAIKRGTVDHDDHDYKLFQKSEEGIVPFFEYYLNTIDEYERIIFRSQIDFSYGVDYILRYESLAEDFSQIQKLLNCHADLVQGKNVLNADKTEFYNNDFFLFVEKNLGEELEKFKFQRPRLDLSVFHTSNKNSKGNGS